MLADPWQRMGECGCICLQNTFCHTCCRGRRSVSHDRVGVQLRFSLAGEEHRGFAYGLLFYQSTMFDSTSKQLYQHLITIQKHCAARSAGQICGSPLKGLVLSQPKALTFDDAPTNESTSDFLVVEEKEDEYSYS